MTPRRYQLRKEALSIVEKDHPWIFRDQLSTAATVFRDGDWLKLVDGTNKTVGYGIYEAEGAIAIRMLRKGADRPDAAWLRGRLKEALARRGLALPLDSIELAAVVDPSRKLASRTNGLRLVHGESDGIPAVVVDRFGDTLVAQSYSRGADALARFSVTAIARELGVPNVLLRPALRRKAPEQPARVLRGSPPDIEHFTEEGVTYAVDLAAGQKSGAYLDLRGLRRTIKDAPLTGARVLNLFAYSGMLGRIAEIAGARSITQVDSSQRALAFAAANHVTDPARHTFVTADVFQWLPTLPEGEMFDLVIVDPPSMTSNKAQVPAVLAGYRKLYRAAAPHVVPGGVLVAACCTSRVEPGEFHKTVSDTLGAGFVREKVIPPEPDHPVGFQQADYLKIGYWRRRG
jgi:23S rRNA (cytosine1962-C5)-methyltransferase